MSSFRSDGKAVYVTLASDVVKNQPTVQDGWAGIALSNGVIGETIALEVEREHEIVVDSAVTADIGDILYIDAATGVVGNSNADIPFGKVTVAKDANNNVSIKLLPQVA